MEIHISLDIYKRMVVRMERGDPSRVIVYSRNPVDKGLEIIDKGLRRIHVVDLEAAIEGRSISKEVIDVARILKSSGGFVTLAGGIKSIRDLEGALGSGADRVVLGTAIYRGLIDPREALGLGANRAALAVDTRRGLVTHSGWRAEVGVGFVEAIERYYSEGFRIFIVTNTERDGVFGGVDRVIIGSIPRIYKGYIIYSGGIASHQDLETLSGEGFRGAIVGRAYYEGIIGLGILKKFEG